MNSSPIPAFTFKNQVSPSSHPRKLKKSCPTDSRSPNHENPNPDVCWVQECVVVEPTCLKVHVPTPNMISHQPDIVEPINRDITMFSNHQRVDLPTFDGLIDFFIDWDPNTTPVTPCEPRAKTRGGEAAVDEEDYEEDSPEEVFVLEKTDVFLELPSIE
jgi:hypothetical protein